MHLPTLLIVFGVCFGNYCSVDVDKTVYSTDQIDLLNAGLRGHTDIVKLMLKYTDCNTTPIVSGYYSKEVGITDAAGITNGFDPDTSDMASIALVLACANGHVETAEALLESGKATPTAAGNLALQIACDAGQLESVQLLQKYIGDEIKDPISLSSVCKDGHTEIVRFLLSFYTDPINNSKALEYARLGKHWDIYNMLLEKGCLPERIHPELPVQIIKSIIDNGYLFRTESGRTLAAASSEANIDVIEYIIASRANLGISLKEQEQPQKNDAHICPVDNNLSLQLGIFEEIHRAIKSIIYLDVADPEKARQQHLLAYTALDSGVTRLRSMGYNHLADVISSKKQRLELWRKLREGSIVPDIIEHYFLNI